LAWQLGNRQILTNLLNGIIFDTKPMRVNGSELLYLDHELEPLALDGPLMGNLPGGGGVYGRMFKS
jgi:hypothetical protein